MAEEQSIRWTLPQVEDQVRTRIYWIIAGISGRRIEQIHDGLDVRRDVGIDGGDAGQLMAALAHAFPIDLRDYDHFDYFGDEGLGPLRGFYLYFFKRHKLFTKPLTVGELVAAARSGYWRKPDKPRGLWERYRGEYIVNHMLLWGSVAALIRLILYLIGW